MRTLYQITDDLIRLNDLLEESGGQISTDAVDALQEYMDGLAKDESRKLDGYVGLIRHLEMELAAAKAEAEQWQTKARVRANRIEWFKSRLKLHLEMTGRTRVETETGRVIAIQANGGTLPVLYESLESHEIPEEFRKVELDRAAVAKALAEGRELPFAAYGERGTHLRIK